MGTYCLRRKVEIVRILGSSDCLLTPIEKDHRKSPTRSPLHVGLFLIGRRLTPPTKTKILSICYWITGTSEVKL